MMFNAAIAAAILVVPSFAAPVEVGGPGSVLSWDGRLFIAARQVAAAAGVEVEEVQLWHAETACSTNCPIKASFVANQFSYDIQETSFNEWTEAEAGQSVEGLTGAGFFNVPVKVDIADAEKTLRAAVRITSKVKEIELAHRITRFTSAQPYYFFTFADGSSHAVGAEDGKLARE